MTVSSHATSSDETGRLAHSKGRVLLIAYHFPPAASSTGHLRTLGFMRHLPAFGWAPVVLSAHPRAYVQRNDSELNQIATDQAVHRAFALDARRHFGWRGKYPGLLALPDRWASWWPDAVRIGLRLIRQHHIDVIWSTYPIMTAHLVALTLSRMSGLPWVADFRDPMKPSNETRLNRHACRWLERRVMNRASHSVFTTPGAKRLYAKRFPEAAQRLSVIPNGFEEATFSHLTRRTRSSNAPLTLVHSGLLYRRGRNPVPFFHALALLKAQGKIDAHRFRVVLRASGDNGEYKQELLRLELTDLVELMPPISYEQALREQATADALLLFQGSEFNVQIPAKVYDYMRLGRPIFALTDAVGDTAALLRETGIASIVEINDDKAIASSLKEFLSRLRTDPPETLDQRVVKKYSRRAGAESFANVLDDAAVSRVI